MIGNGISKVAAQIEMARAELEFWRKRANRLWALVYEQHEAPEDLEVAKDALVYATRRAGEARLALAEDELLLQELRFRDVLRVARRAAAQLDTGEELVK